MIRKEEWFMAEWEINGFKYCFDTVSGAMQTGWNEINGNKYYYTDAGLPQENKI